MKYRPSTQGIIAVVIITILLLVAGWLEVAKAAEVTNHFFRDSTGKTWVGTSTTWSRNAPTQWSKKERAEMKAYRAASKAQRYNLEKAFLRSPLKVYTKPVKPLLWDGVSQLNEVDDR